jgi:hypothetical protein
MLSFMRTRHKIYFDFCFTVRHNRRHGAACGPDERVLGMNSETAEKKKRMGRPCLEGSIEASPILGIRVSPATLEAVKRESARRGMVPSALIREALDMLLKQAEQRQAA